MDLKQQIDGKLQTESEKLAQIAEQLHADAETRKAVQQKAEVALGRVSNLLHKQQC